jgi:hypothetical protein
MQPSARRADGCYSFASRQTDQWSEQGVQIVINVICACGRKLRIGDEFAGQTGQCPACGANLLIPETTVAVTAPPEIFQDMELPTPRAVEQTPADTQETQTTEEEPLLNHGGKPLPADIDFFIPPPAEIGPLRSACSTLRQGNEPIPLAARLFIMAPVGGLLWFVCTMILFYLDIRNPFWKTVLPMVVVLVGAYIVVRATRFRHTCSYVGQEGVARYICSGKRDNITTSELFLFRGATDLRTATTIRYYNGAYQGTDYSFTWSDISGQPRYQVKGSHNSEPGTPPAKDPYQFGRAAEINWTLYLIQGAYELINMGGSVLFTIKGGDWIKLGKGVLTLSTGGSTVEWPVEDIRDCAIKQGIVRIRRKDAKEGWFSVVGVYKFSFNHLANAQLFFHMLDKVVGVPLT